MIGPGTQRLQARVPTIIRTKLFEPYGHDVVIVFPAQANGEYGATVAVGSELPVRAALIPAGTGAQAAAAGAGLPVPGFEFYVLRDDLGAHSLDVPGWYVRMDGINYYPTADARNEGGQGIVYFAPLGAPGEVTSGLPSEPGWTG